MKVLHLNCSDIGSTGKLIADISKFLSAKNVESVLCTPSVKGEKEKYLKKYKTSLPLEQGL